MTTFDHWQEQWHEDVFAMDDYHQSPDGSVQIYPPLPGVPYMLAETVGQRTYTEKGFGNFYRRAGDVAVQCKQAIYHAQAHDRAGAYERFCGVIAWCAFEYGSPQNSYKGVKNPGVADVFRIPKLGASFYQSQVSPDVRPVIVPNFYWDFGPSTPRGPGENAAIFSNCERLEIFVDHKHHATLEPDRKNYPNLRYAPFFADLSLDGTGYPVLRIDGYAAGHLALSRSFCSDASKDQFLINADDAAITGDGIDATRLVFRVADRFGAPRLFAGGDVDLRANGSWRPGWRQSLFARRERRRRRDLDQNSSRFFGQDRRQGHSRDAGHKAGDDRGASRDFSAENLGFVRIEWRFARPVRSQFTCDANSPACRHGPISEDRGTLAQAPSIYLMERRPRRGNAEPCYT